MRKIILSTLFVLILATSLVKNSTKKIEDKTFDFNESIRSLKVEFSDVMLEYNFLSSPEKLIEFQSQYFEKDLIKVDIMKVKKLSKNKKLIELNDFIEKR